MTEIKTQRLMKRYEGVPPIHLAAWRYLPLHSKLPMPPIVPSGILSLYRGNGDLGDSIWREHKCFDFNLWDPHLKQLPTPLGEYDSLSDEKLRAYFANEDLLRMVFRQGLVARNGKVLCTLKELNHYRAYQHRINIELLRTNQLCTEEKDINEMIFRTLKVVQDRRSAMVVSGQEDAYTARIDYVCILQEEARQMREQWEKEFLESKIYQNSPEGEKDYLKIVHRMLKKDLYIKAMMRLKRLQAYEDFQNKGWLQWKTRGLRQVQDRAATIIREKILEEERNLHIREHIQITACQSDKFFKKIEKSRGKFSKSLDKKMKNVQKKICLESKREYPLSARCPPNVFDGGQYGDPCRWEILAQQLESDLYVEDSGYANEINKYISNKVIKPAFSHYRGKQAEPHLQAAAASKKPSTTEPVELGSQLSDNIVRNALDLLIKHLRLPVACKGNRINQLQAAKLKHYIQELKMTITDELDNLLKNRGESLKVIVSAIQKAANQKTSIPKSNKEQDEAQSKNKWGNAPLLKTNSQTLMGRYVRDQLVKVSQKLRCQGQIMEDATDAASSVLNRRVQDAVDEATSTNTIDLLRCRLVNGEDTVKQAESILKQENVNESLDIFIVALVTFLLRCALLKLKDSLVCRQIVASDLLALSSAININLILRSVLQKATLEKLVDRYAEELVQSKAVSSLIVNTAIKIGVTEKQDEEVENVEYQIKKAARIFISKILDNLIKDSNNIRKKVQDQTKLIEEDLPPCDFIPSQNNNSATTDKNNNNSLTPVSNINNNTSALLCSQEGHLDDKEITQPNNNEDIDQSIANDVNNDSGQLFTPAHYDFLVPQGFTEQDPNNVVSNPLKEVEKTSDRKMTRQYILASELLVDRYNSSDADQSDFDSDSENEFAASTASSMKEILSGPNYDNMMTDFIKFAQQPSQEEFNTKYDFNTPVQETTVKKASSATIQKSSIQKMREQQREKRLKLKSQK